MLNLGRIYYDLGVNTQGLGHASKQFTTFVHKVESDLGRLGASINDSAKKAEAIGDGFKRASDKAGKELDSLQKKSKIKLGEIKGSGDEGASAIDRMNGSLKGLIATYISFQGLQVFTSFLDEANAAREGIWVLYTDVSKANDVFELLKITASNTGREINTVTSLFQRMYFAKEPIGATTAEMLKVTEAFLNLGRISKTESAKFNEVAIQFAQGLITGKFEAEEFQSVLEGVPAVLPAIATGMGKTTDEVIRLKKEGKLTSKEVFFAILNQVTEIEKRAKKMQSTVGMSLNKQRNIFTSLTLAYEDNFNVTGKIVGAIETLGKVGKIAATELGLLLMTFKEIKNAAKEGRWLDKDKLIKEYEDFIKSIDDVNRKQAQKPSAFDKFMDDYDNKFKEWMNKDRGKGIVGTEDMAKIGREAAEEYWSAFYEAYYSPSKPDYLGATNSKFFDSSINDAIKNKTTQTLPSEGFPGLQQTQEDPETQRLIKSFDEQKRITDEFQVWEQSRYTHGLGLYQSFVDAKKVISDSFAKTSEEDLETQKRNTEENGRIARQAIAAGAQNNKRLFELNKALTIADIIMRTPGVVAAAFDWGMKTGGPIAPALAAAAATAAGGAMAVQLAVASQASFQGGRALGGDVYGGGMYRVNEQGPEMFSSGGKDYLLPSKSGVVTPIMSNNSGDGGNVYVTIKTMPGTTATVNESTTSKGTELEVIIREVDNRMASGIQAGNTRTSKALQNTYGLNRVSGAYA